MSLRNISMMKSLFTRADSLRCLCYNKNVLNIRERSTVSDNAEVFTKMTTNPDINNIKELSFDELLQKSPLMQFGRADNKCVVGKVVEICNDDLYVDFGGKFEAVVKRRELQDEVYEIGTLVRIILHKFEMTGQFLGDGRHVTLNEADALLIGLYEEKNKKK